MIIQLTPIVSIAKSKWYDHQQNEKIVLNSPLQTYQILTNDDQILTLCLYYFITTVLPIGKIETLLESKNRQIDTHYCRYHAHGAHKFL